MQRNCTPSCRKAFYKFRHGKRSHLGSIAEMYRRNGSLRRTDRVRPPLVPADDVIRESDPVRVLLGDPPPGRSTLDQVADRGRPRRGA